MLKDQVLAAVNPVRRRVPPAGVRAIVATRTGIDLRSRARLTRARAEMEHLMGAEVSAVELDVLAERFVQWMRRRGEYRWHPELIGHQPVSGLDHFRDARALGRGVLVSFLHHAHFDGSFLSLRRAGLEDLHAIVHPLMVAGGGGNFMRQHAHLCSLGGILHSTDIGSDGIVDLLERGKPVFIASDVPGRTPVRFLSRDRVGSSGAPRIARRTGSPVVVMTFDRGAGDQAGVRFHAPLDPAAYPTPEALLEAMLGVHETAIRAWPEAYDEPLKRWGTP